MNRRFRSLTALQLMAAALILGMANAAEPIVIKFSHVVTDNTPKGQGALMFKALVEERLPEKYRVEVYPNSSLYGDGQEIEALITGNIQVIAPSLSKFEHFSKGMQVYDLPFIFDDIGALGRMQQSPEGQALLTSMEGQGMTGLGYWHGGTKVILADKKIRTPGDMRGLKIRVQPSSVLAETFKALRANPRKMSFNEIYQGLQTGVINSVENTYSHIYSQKFYEVQKYITELQHGYIDNIILVNTTFWRSLPEEDRLVIHGILVEVTERVNQITITLDASDKAQVLATGRVEITTLTPEERAAFRTMLSPVWQKFTADIGAPLIDAAIRSNTP